MNKMRIKLRTIDDTNDFINICSKYDCDINVYDGSNIIDAKSAIGMFCIPQGKEIRVQAISSDENTIVAFVNEMRKFEV